MSVWTSEEARRLQPAEDVETDDEPEDDDAYDRARDLAAENE